MSHPFEKRELGRAPFSLGMEWVSSRKDGRSSTAALTLVARCSPRGLFRELK
jgi:hypothetical protein